MAFVFIAIYIIGFFATFYIATRSGDELYEAVIGSLIWPAILALLLSAYLFMVVLTLLERLYGKIRGIHDAND